MTEHELIDYHLHHGSMPVAFAPALNNHKPRSPSNGSDKSNVVALPRLNAGPAVHTPKQTTHHTRLGSFSASIRHSFFSLRGSSPPSSPTGSIFNFGLSRKAFHRPSAVPAPTNENQRTIMITAFSPLLPDELVLKQGMREQVTVLQTYDDGWCIVARTNMGVLEIGAVPEWVFGLRKDEEAVRPMRSTSLGVTVNVPVLDEGGDNDGSHWALAMTSSRASIISWSNF